MKQKLRYKIFLYTTNMFFYCIFLCLPTIATENKSVTNTYLDRDNVKKFITKLHYDNNIPIEKIESIVKQAKKSDKALELISKPIESNIDLNSYKNIFITNKMLSKGIAFWNKNEAILMHFEEKMGIPPAIIVSLLGVESRFGENSGGFKVLDVLATLSFDFPRREKFFQKELEHFLIFLCKQNASPDDFTGSYAGAMGMPQFMPSSYKYYAISYNSANTPDIWHKDHDSIASIANYMHKNGWKKNGMVATKIIISGSKSEEICHNKNNLKYTVRHLRKNGCCISKEIAETEAVLPMMHKGETSDDFWIGFHNFGVITKYNRSQIYALTVHLLAEALEKQRSLIPQTPNQLNDSVALILDKTVLHK
jgi:membrane-bound lytic murein transglycosylase B